MSLYSSSQKESTVKCGDNPTDSGRDRNRSREHPGPRSGTDPALDNINVVFELKTKPRPGDHLYFTDLHGMEYGKDG